MTSRSIIAACSKSVRTTTSLLLSNSNKFSASSSTTKLSKSSAANGQTRSISSCLMTKKAQTIINSNNNKAMFHVSPSKFADEILVVEAPAFAESIAEGDVKYEKAVGDYVKQDELVAKIETDKTAMDVFAPQAGTITEFLFEDGDTIGPHAPILKIQLGGAAPAPATPATPAAPAASAPAVPAVPVPAAPVSSSAGGPSSVASPPPLPSTPASVARAAVPAPLANINANANAHASASANLDINKISGTRGETRVKMSKMRKTVAGRLKDAQNTTAMLTTFNEINMGNLMEMRKSYGEAFLKRHNIKLGFMSAFIKASAAALVDQPTVNAAIIEGANQISYRDYVDVSVAVATPKGLVVPVLRNVEKMNYADIEKEIASVGEKAKTGKLAIEDMQGGTFTISNGGVFGSLFGTPIINPPQSAILGMHGIFDRPIAVNGQVVIKPMMYVALTYDHRLIDGREAVTFLRKIKAGVEDPRSLLLD